MSQAGKKIIAFMFLMITAMPVFLSVKFIVEEKLLQEKAEEKLESGVLQSVNVSNAELSWIKEGKEVLIEGKLFDVKSFSTANGMVSLVGFFDMEETELEEQFKNTVQNKDSDSPFSQLVIKFLISPTYISQTEIKYEASWSSVSKEYYSFDEMIPASLSYSLAQPPRV